jgi:hypothetical protein
LWADFVQSNTIVLAGMPSGQHKVLIELVDVKGNVFSRQTVTFYSQGKGA